MISGTKAHAHARAQARAVARAAQGWAAARVCAGSGYRGGSDGGDQPARGRQEAHRNAHFSSLKKNKLYRGRPISQLPKKQTKKA
jgi:hypothetical protein